MAAARACASSARDDLVEAVEGARREAASSFGDATVFLERYLERSRHVEVQVFGDAHGNVVHLFERECSIQRRHQKVVEESPSPGATPATLERMYAAAVSLASAIGYVGAGTVEFLVAGEGDTQEFFFLEMNTRLQVEHPVTEMVTGLDLVEWQLLVAQGEPLPMAQNDIERSGHAIEVRLYAEDPAHDFLPSTGTLAAWSLDLWAPGVRVDSAVEEESEVSPYYDPMLAKVIGTPTSARAAAARARRRPAPACCCIGPVSPPTAMLAADPASRPPSSPATRPPPSSTSTPRCWLLPPRPMSCDGTRSPPPRSPSATAASTRDRYPDAVPLGLAQRAGRAGGAAALHGADVRTAVVAREWRREGSTYRLGLDVDDATAAQAIAADERFELVDGVVLSVVVVGTPWSSATTGVPARGRRHPIERAVVGRRRVAPGVLGDALSERPALRRGRSSTTACTGRRLDVVEPWFADHAHDGGGARADHVRCPARSRTSRSPWATRSRRVRRSWCSRR